MWHLEYQMTDGRWRQFDMVGDDDLEHAVSRMMAAQNTATGYRIIHH